MVNMKILDLPLKEKWYEMIESGNKKEEYREIKKYWIGRLAKCGGRNSTTLSKNSFGVIDLKGMEKAALMRPPQCDYFFPIRKSFHNSLNCSPK